MAGAALGDGDEIIAAINITPMVDIILVLLIVFMVTTTLMQNPVVPIKLPRAESNRPQNQENPPKTLNVMVSKDHKIMIDGLEYTVDQTRDLFKKEIEADDRLVVVLGGELDVEYKYVMEILDMTRIVGVKNLSLNVQLARTGQAE